METKKPHRLLTVNQLIDKINSMPIDAMTPELGVIRQDLINTKKTHPKGGLIKSKNSGMIATLVEGATLKHEKQGAESAMIVHPTC